MSRVTDEMLDRVANAPSTFPAWVIGHVAEELQERRRWDAQVRQKLEDLATDLNWLDRTNAAVPGRLYETASEAITLLDSAP